MCVTHRCDILINFDFKLFSHHFPAIFCMDFSLFTFVNFCIFFKLFVTFIYFERASKPVFYLFLFYLAYASSLVFHHSLGICKSSSCCKSRQLTLKHFHFKTFGQTREQYSGVPYNGAIITVNLL